MTLSEMLNTIAGSNSDDWTAINRPTFLQSHQETRSGSSRWIEVQEHHTLLSYRENLSISIAFGLPHVERFNEPWTRVFADPEATSQFVDFLYNGIPVLREISVLVDGARARLPLPDPSDMSVPKLQVAVFRLLDATHGIARFDDYFERAKMVSTEEEWP